jgi:hypothetical protein
MDSLLYLHFDVDGELLTGARDCEEEVFLRAFGNTHDQLVDEYGSYEDHSFYLAVADAAGYVYGSCRLIESGPAGLKTLNDVARDPWRADGYRAARAVGMDPSRTWDVGTLGVRDVARGQGLMVAIALYHGLVLSTRANEIPWITAILDGAIRRILNSADYVMPTLPGLASAPYMGSTSSTPVWAHCASVIDRQRQVNPDAYRLMSQGIGLDGISVPGTSAFQHRRAARVELDLARATGVLVDAR